MSTSDVDNRIAVLERALQRQKAASRELEQILENRTRELFLAMERSKRQARLVGARTAIVRLAEHRSLEAAAPSIFEAFGHELGWQIAHLWLVDEAEQVLRCRVQWSERGIAVDDFKNETRATRFPRDIGLPGRVWSSARPVWVKDVTIDSNFPRAQAAQRDGVRAGCAFPIMVDGAVHAVIEMFTMQPLEQDDDLLVTFGSLGSQIGQFLERLRVQDELRVKELQIAREIQTSILPRNLSVAGVEVSALMITASEVGGDYFDVLPFRDGAWFGIGDVTGHGVGAGMIMVMVQSAIAALAADGSRTSPRDLVLALNRCLYDNIRNRLRGNDHVTFSLLRYTKDGKVIFAGAHEELILWRARTLACELIETPGAWLGAAPAIDNVTWESSLQLERGDLLILYTDGLIEARNAGRQQIGIERMCAEVAALASEQRPTQEICEHLVLAAKHWNDTQEDDISVVAIRYRGE